jgi:uncharacterized protein with ATP-grasp and redox domains
MVTQALTAMSLNHINDETQKSVIRNIMNLLKVADDKLPPSEIAGATNQIIRDITGIDDLYAEIKQESTKKALAFYPRLKELVKKSDNPVDMALRISAAGNAIDVIHATQFNMDQIIDQVIHLSFIGGGYDDFMAKLKKARYLLLLADNAGETVFDRVLIETLSIPVKYAVKSGPILNDATRMDAIDSGLDEIAEIIETGSNGPGTTLHQCSDVFQSLMRSAPLVLAKGQANFETLENQPYEHLYLMFKTKCPIISRHLKLPSDHLVLMHA